MLTVFWPGINSSSWSPYKVLHWLPQKCTFTTQCTTLPHSDTRIPLFSDVFSYQGAQYLVAVDQYSNWPIIKRKYNGLRGLIDCLCRLFATYGIPGKLASDSKPEFTTGTTSTCRIEESAIVYLLLLSHTQTAGQKWLLKQPGGSLHWIQDPMTVLIPMPFNRFSSCHNTPDLQTLGCIVSLNNLLKTSSQYCLADRNLVLPGLTHSTKRGSSKKPSYANYLRMVLSH